MRRQCGRCFARVGASEAGGQVGRICIQGRSPTCKPLDSLWACGVGIIHRELLDLIGEDIVDRDLHLGKVTNSRGKEVAEWVTFHGRETVIVRGSKEARYSTCPECGRNRYYAAGKRYLFPAPTDEASIYQSHLSGLVVPPDVYERVASVKWRTIGVDKLRIVDEPADGLGLVPYREPNYPKQPSV